MIQRQIILRSATLDDVPAILDLGRAFYAALGAGAPLDDARCEALVRSLIVVPEGWLQVVEDRGALVGALAAAEWMPLFTAEKQAAELGWWIASGSRGGLAAPRMLRDLESWAKGRGCTSLVLSSLIGLKGDAVRQMYERAGYTAREMRFEKVFACPC